MTRPLRTSGLDHVAVAVRDADDALRWYRDVLGLAVLSDEVAEGPGSRLVHLDAGPVVLQLVQPLRGNAVADFLDARGEGLHHLCFEVDDVGAALRDVDDRTSTVFAAARGRRGCFLTDVPEGVAVELVDRRTHLPPAAGG